MLKEPSIKKCSVDEILSPGYTQGLSSVCRTTELSIQHARLEKFVNSLDWVKLSQQLVNT